jgi:RNA polymerase sigma factor (sigma-70 family)
MTTPRRRDRNALVLSHQGLVRSIALKYSPNGFLDDLISEGNLALLRAAEKFDDSRGYAFSTYAYPRIDGAIKRAFAKERFWRAPNSLERLSETGRLVADQSVSQEPISDEAICQAIRDVEARREANGVCRCGCGLPLTGRKRTWHSESHRHEYARRIRRVA